MDKFNEAWNEWIKGNETKASQTWFEIMNISKELNNENAEIDAKNYLIMYQRVWEGKEEELIDLNKTLTQAQSISYQKGIADSLIELALQTNSPEIANKNFQEAREIYTKINDKSGLIKLIYWYGTYLVKRGIEKFGYIFKQFQIGLQYAIEENNKYYIAQIHHGLGEAFLRLGNLTEARHHFEISLQIFKYLQNERKILELLVSIADAEIQTQTENPHNTLNIQFEEFREYLEQNQDKIPISDRFNHLSRFSDLFLELDDFKKVNVLISELDKILRQSNMNSSLYFQGKMALALIKGNVEFAKLNLTNSEHLYSYILRRRDQATISDLYGALISLAIISIYKYRIFFDINHLSVAQELIQDAIKISEETDHIRGYVRASMVDAMLKITLGGTNDDLTEMEDVLRVAQEKGLNVESRKAQQELARFKRIIQLQKKAKIEDKSVAEVLQYALEAKKVVRKNQ
jgi:hypothetical protein